MYQVNEDNSIYATRGDIVILSVSAEKNGEPYTFQAGEVLRIKVYGKKDAESVVLQKDFPVTAAAQTVDLFLSEEDTKIGEVISKPKDYWYEVELNPYDNPQTIIGYDEDGAKVFKLFPEGDDIPEYVPDPEVLKVIDTELDMSSERPVQNQVIARAFANLQAGYQATHEAVAKIHVTPEMYGAVGDGVADDTKAIQDAIDSGADVFIPEGTYYIGSTLTVSEAKRIYGAGDKTIIKSDASVAMITTGKSVIVEKLRFEGNGGTALSVHQTNNTIRDVSIEGFVVGITNKNSDYMGSVRIERVLFNNTDTCFSCTTLCNGVTFDKCVAYHFDEFISAHWLEGVSLNDCFLELGNGDSAVIRKNADKTSLNCFGVNFNGCYIEHVTNLIYADVLTGTVNICGCWLFHKDGESLYEGRETSGGCKFNFNGNTFGLNSEASATDLLMGFSDTQTAIFSNNTAIINSKGVIAINRSMIVGKKVYFAENGIAEIHRVAITATTDANGIVEFPINSRLVIGCYARRADEGGYVNVNYTVAGNNWKCVVTSLSGSSVLASKEVVLMVTYVALGDVIDDANESV